MMWRKQAFPGWEYDLIQDTEAKKREQTLGRAQCGSLDHQCYRTLGWGIRVPLTHSWNRSAG